MQKEGLGPVYPGPPLYVPLPSGHVYGLFHPPCTLPVVVAPLTTSKVRSSCSTPINTLPMRLSVPPITTSVRARLSTPLRCKALCSGRRRTSARSYGEARGIEQRRLAKRQTREVAARRGSAEASIAPRADLETSAGKPGSGEQHGSPTRRVRFICARHGEYGPNQAATAGGYGQGLVPAAHSVGES
jgi:hypothetical protein